MTLFAMELFKNYFIVINKKLEGESCSTFSDSSTATPSEGWALFMRSPNARLDPCAREFLVGLFTDGRKNKNLRSSPQTAEIKLRNQFPDCEKCWLSVKQVDFRGASKSKKRSFFFGGGGH